MKITIFAAGSQGDIRPCIALGKGLQQAGYQIRLAVPADFSDLIEKHGVNFFPLRGDIKEIMAGETGKDFMETGGSNPVKSILAVRKMITPIVLDIAEDVYAACRDSDALICLGVFSAFGQSVADALRIPIIHVEPTPLLPTRSFAAPSWPIQSNLGGLHNYISGVAMLQVVWFWYLPFIREFRHRLGLPVYTNRRFFNAFQSTPTIAAYSPTLIPHPLDWPESLHITGYLFLDSQENWQPAEDLAAFLDAGDPPVYIVFSSMAGQSPERLAEIVMRALKKCDQRGVLLTGWGGMRPNTLSEHVFVLENAPHHWLFPRMVALVHHGGAGTTAEGLRAGVPTVTVPFILDQPFWGARLKALGVGPDPIPQKVLTADRLAAAITTAILNLDIKKRARSIGESIRSENGVENAVRVVQRYLG